MRKVIWQVMFTLDGFMAGPNGEPDWHVIDDAFARYVAEMPETGSRWTITPDRLAAHVRGS
jgi:hypothetical protein